MWLWLVVGAVLYLGFFLLVGWIDIKTSSPSKKELKKREEYKRSMWANYNHLCKTWASLLEKWANLPIQNKGQIPEDPVPFLADFKSRCALRVARGQCNCFKSCDSCRRMQTDASCVSQCENSCLTCVHFPKYANCYVQLSEFQQLEIDQLASEYFCRFI